MTGALHVDPDQINNAGARWYALIPQLESAPPNNNSAWPSSVGAAAVTAAAGESTAVLQNRLAATAGSAQAAGAAYQGQESQNMGALKPGDITSIMGDLVGVATALIPTVPQLVQSTTSAISSAASGGASAVSSLVSTLAHGSGISPGSSVGGGAPQVAATENHPPSSQHHQQEGN